jgi:hypothetical protein
MKERAGTHIGGEPALYVPSEPPINLAKVSHTSIDVAAVIARVEGLC